MNLPVALERTRSGNGLEMLPETTGRFCLNVELPTAFDGWGHMEVDLLCVDARVAIELDGAQHLADADA
jgi:hypothetical protein